MADVRPFSAIRYSPDLDLAAAICPPFDVISLEQQRALHERSPYNAVHIELPYDGNGDRYSRAADTLTRWLNTATLRRESSSSLYLYDQQFSHSGRAYTRRTLFVRLRLEPWETGKVLPHEQTFGGPKEDRLKLLRALRLNTSPIFLLYRDEDRKIDAMIEDASGRPPNAEFAGDDGQTHAVRVIDDPATIEALPQAFEAETLYVADGHHRYETALAYRDERRAAASSWTGDEPENFVLAALVSAQDPGLLVLPIHRVIAAGHDFSESQDRLKELFQLEPVPTDELAQRLENGDNDSSVFGLVTAGSEDAYLLAISRADAVDALLPRDRSAAWRNLDYAIANHVILRHALGLTEAQMSDYSTLWFTEDAAQAIADVRSGRARYAVLMNPVPVTRILDVADSGERMPQKSTFFYPKLPTGLVFNPLED